MHVEMWMQVGAGKVRRRVWRAVPRRWATAAVKEGRGEARSCATMASMSRGASPRGLKGVVEAMVVSC